jgi:hypothetical protein
MNTDQIVRDALADLFERDLIVLESGRLNGAKELRGKLECAIGELRQNEIPLGYVALASYKSTKKLFPDWLIEDAKEDKELAERIAQTPPDEVILAGGTSWTLVIDYPLSTPCNIPLRAGDGGMTRRQVVNAVVDAYRKIYREEAKTTRTKPGFLPHSFNRNKTDGKHGIWGHVLGDLTLHTLCIHGNTLRVGVDS